MRAGAALGCKLRNERICAEPGVAEVVQLTKVRPKVDRKYR
jgi:hypothetical protein